MKRLALISTFFLLVAFVPSLFAQGLGSEEEAPQTFQGELVSVDDAAQTLTVRDSEGTEMQFTYNDETQVSGADEGVAGLATKSGAQVAVSYQEEGASKTAVQIHIME